MENIVSVSVGQAEGCCTSGRLSGRGVVDTEGPAVLRRLTAPFIHEPSPGGRLSLQRTIWRIL